MTRARKTATGPSGSTKNSVLPAMGGGKSGPKPIKNSIAVRPGANSSSKVKNAIALKGC